MINDDTVEKWFTLNEGKNSQLIEMTEICKFMDCLTLVYSIL